MSTDKTKLDRLWREVWKPPDRSPPWLWAENHVESIPFSPVPGRFRSENSPWVREPLEALVDPGVRLVSIIASIQCSKTCVGEIGIAFIIANLPGPALWLDQTDEDAKDQSESRLQKLFDEIGPVKNLYPRDRHKKKNAAIQFRNGMTLWILGAHNKTNLQRRSIRWLIGDETWRWPPGHMAEAEARVTAFGWLGKCLFMSQAGEDGDDTQRKFETTDQRVWTFQCPHCGLRQPFKWDNIEWSKSARSAEHEWDYEEVKRTTVMQCSGCNHCFEDSDRVRRELNASGRFVATNTKAASENVGFHWNALCAMSWGRLAEMYLRAKAIARQGDFTILKQFYQKRLAIPWRENAEDYKLEIERTGYQRGELWEQEAAFDRRGRIIPGPYKPEEAAAPLRILTVDVQLDHLWAVVRCWSGNGSSRLLWNERILTFEDIAGLQERFTIHPNLVFLDAGHAAYEVYRQCADHGWIALIGDRRPTFLHKGKDGKSIHRFYSARRKVVLSAKKVCSVFYWSNLNIKDILGRLRRNQRPENGPTWEVPDDIDDNYLAQMESETRVNENGKWLWKQIGQRPNHLWDCECMQVVAAVMLKLIGREFTPPSPGGDDEEEDAPTNTANAAYDAGGDFDNTLEP